MAKSQYCRKCGNRLPSESAFCPTCGTALDADVHTPTSSSRPETAQSETGRLPAGRMLHQRYRLLQTVGQGGMGAVYVAQDAQLGDRLVAVKEMSMSRLYPQELPKAVEQFQQEAHLLASLHHPNLPAIHDYFSEGERWYLVMQFIEGGTLQSSLNAAPGNRFPIKEVVRLGIELCEVLDYLHTHQPQVIFRDLKPLNIMLTPKGHITLIDFGIARHFKQEQTKDTTYYYSVGYAPPEQYGEAQTGPRSDLYSLGATLHQMLSGHSPSSKPFQFPNLQLIDPAIPVSLAQLITQMLEMNEQSRPSNAAEVKARLETVLSSGPVAPTLRAEPDPQRSFQAPPVIAEPLNAGQHFLAPTNPPVAENQSATRNTQKSTALFAHRWQNIVWTCAVALTVILTLLWGLNESSSAIVISSLLILTIGLVASLTKGRFLTDTIGGILLILLGEFAQISGFFYYAYYLSGILLLGIGASLFLHRLNRVGGVIFGTFLILVLGLGALTLTGGQFNLYVLSFIISPIVIGIVTIIVTLRTKNNKAQKMLP